MVIAGITDLDTKRGEHQNGLAADSSNERDLVLYTVIDSGASAHIFRSEILVEKKKHNVRNHSIDTARGMKNDVRSKGTV